MKDFAIAYSLVNGHVLFSVSHTHTTNKDTQPVIMIAYPV